MSVCHHIDPRFRGWTDDASIEARRAQRRTWDDAHLKAMNAVVALFPDRRRYSDRWVVVHVLGWVQVHCPSDEQIQDAAMAVMCGEVFSATREAARVLAAWSIAVFYRYTVDGFPRRTMNQ